MVRHFQQEHRILLAFDGIGKDVVLDDDGARLKSCGHLVVSVFGLVSRLDTGAVRDRIAVDPNTHHGVPAVGVDQALGIVGRHGKRPIFLGLGRVDNRVVRKDNVLEVGVDGLQQVHPHRVNGNVVRDRHVLDDAVVLLDLASRRREVSRAAFPHANTSLTVVVVEADVANHRASLHVYDFQATTLDAPEGRVGTVAIDYAIEGNLVVRGHDHDALCATRIVHARAGLAETPVMHVVAEDLVVRAVDCDAHASSGLGTSRWCEVGSVGFAIADCGIRLHHDTTGRRRHRLDSLDRGVGDGDGSIEDWSRAATIGDDCHVVRAQVSGETATAFDMHRVTAAVRQFERLLGSGFTGPVLGVIAPD